MAWTTPLATHLLPPAFHWRHLLGILVCMVGARSAAMAFNRLVDRRIDAENPRTKTRHLPAGILSAASVWLFTLASAAVFIAGTLLFLPNWLPVVLSLPVLLFLLGYSYAKRFTALAHFWLGTALMLAPVCAWIAIRGEVLLTQPADILPAVLLGAAVLAWVSGFDIIYACQDAEFDRRASLKSVPALLGVPARIAAGRRVPLADARAAGRAAAVLPAAFAGLDLRSGSRRGGRAAHLRALPGAAGRLDASQRGVLQYQCHHQPRPARRRHGRSAPLTQGCCMPRSIWIFVATLILAAAGCGRSTPPAPPPSAPTPPATSAAADPAPPAAAAPSTTTPAPAPPVAESGLRGLFARYLNSDGAGGWRPNEQAATELEKLAPPADQVLPLLADSRAEVRRSAAFYWLGSFDPAQPGQVAAFTALLADSDRTTRGIGLTAVKQMPAADQLAALPKLAEMLDPAREDKADNRAAIARLFGSHRSQAASGLPALAASARSDPDGKVRAAGLAAIAQIAPAAEAVAP